MKERLVVIGNGMAGVRTVEEILERDPDRYEIRSLEASNIQITIELCFRMYCRKK